MLNKHKILSLLLALILLLSAGCALKPKPEPAPETEDITCGQAGEVICAAANRYRDGLTPALLLESIPDGAAREKQLITYAEAFVMLNLAFNGLPEPVGDWLRISPAPAVYSDMPDWAESAVSSLNKAEILYIVRDNLLSGDSQMKRTELSNILRRIYSLLGTNLKDDFYTAVNKEFLDNSVLTGNAVTINKFDDMASKAFYQYEDMFEGILGGSWSIGTPDRKVVDFYESFVNMDARNAAGVTPLTPYLDAVDAADNLQDLERVQVKITDELAFYPFFNFILIADSQTINYIVTFYVKYNGALAGMDIDAPGFRGYLGSVVKLF